MFDVPFGTIATALACVGIMFSKHLLVAITFPVVFNVLIIGWELTFFGEPFWFSALFVGLGELAVMVIAYVFFFFIKRTPHFLNVIRATQNRGFKF